MLQNSQVFQKSNSQTQRASHINARRSEVLFQLQDVSVVFGSIWALKNIQLNIQRGEVLFITGTSGAGKTTLLRLLGGELNPTSGKVLRADPKKCFLSQVFQDLRLMLDRSCEDNIMMAYDPALYAKKKDFIKDMHELCRILGVSDRLGLKMRNANGGLKQKVAIIRSLLTKPDVFIADEPTSSLDAQNAKKIFDILNLYNVKRGLTVVWASHNRELVKSFTGKIAHLDGGRLVYSGHACFI